MLISICIPVYNRLNYLKRLLHSIEQQSFKDFEVIITDDSTTLEIELFFKKETFPFSIQYIKNNPAKGTPLNWMEGIKYAKGNWIKIMHDDDWFSHPNALQSFATSTTTSVDCIFSGYHTFYESDDSQKNNTISINKFNRLINYPYILFAKNVIGPPSVLLFKKEMQELFDPQLKWLVDIEAYIRMMKHYKCAYIAQPLIIMSNNDSQVTNDCFRNKDVEVKEALIYYKKHGEIVASKMMAYDAWWRMLRNLNIRSEEELIQCAKGEDIPMFLKRLLFFQKKIPLAFLKNGLISKLMMAFSFFKKQ